MAGISGIQRSASMPMDCGMPGMHNNPRKPVENKSADVAINPSSRVNKGPLGEKVDITA
jgi:hypothetical protein